MALNSNGAPGNVQNDPTGKVVSTHSSFPLLRRRFQTDRFGDITPTLAIEGVETDRLPLQAGFDLRTYTLGNVLMSDVKKHVEYFFVNYDSLLPRNWEKVYTNPTQGDDVLPDVNTWIPFSVIHSRLSFLVTCLNDSAASYSAAVVLRLIIELEAWLSSGSLLRYLGYSLGNPLNSSSDVYDPNLDNSRNYCDIVCEGFYQILADACSSNDMQVSFVDSDNNVETFFVRSSLLESYGNILCFRDFLQRCRENMHFSLIVPNDVDVHSLWMQKFGTMVLNMNSSTSDGINYNRVAAYQIVCAHFFSNDHVDYIYSADLYRQLMSSLASLFYAETASFGLPRFNYNGVYTEYDALSGRVFADILSVAEYEPLYDSMPLFYLSQNYIMSLLGFRRSLRYRDYFVGAKPFPLAIGDVNVAVNNNLVSIIDTTKKIATQRFLNQVNRVGRKIKDYIQGLFPGAKVEPSIYDPTWLARTDSDVRPVENENTASEQYELDSSVTSVLRGRDSGRYAFEVEVGRPGIVIGVTYYDLPRAYAYSMDRNCLVSDRYDMFIPQMQFIGDQDIKRIELGDVSSRAFEPFAYTLRDMQYKQLFDIACGGFVDQLPGWCFRAPSADTLMQQHISPLFIRSSNYEFDKYYLSLTGFGLAAYFHFIVVVTNSIDSKRPMAFAPTIL